MKKYRYLFSLVLLWAVAMPMFSQVVSNDNEDEVYKVDSRFAKNDFVPGQVLVKFKDESTIQVQRVNGRFRSASLNSVNRLLREYGVSDMNKLFPNEVAKPKSQLRKVKASNGDFIQEKNLDKIYLIEMQSEEVDSTLQLVSMLNELEEVEYAEPNYRVYITGFSNQTAPETNYANVNNIRHAPTSVETDKDAICTNPEQNPLYSEQWGIKALNIDKLWDKPIINKKRPVIAILDTGVDITHPDLADNIWTNPNEGDGEMAYDDDNNGYVDDLHGWDFTENYPDTPDRNMHGTHCAGIAAACDNENGIVGANPLALIMPVKVLNDRGEGDVATICKGIIYAADNGADIISMSFGGPSLSGAEADALSKAYQTAILVGAAGNNGLDIYDSLHGGTSYPGAYKHVIGVQASASNGNLAGFSNYDPDGPIYSEDGIDGRNYEVKAPGISILSTIPSGNYKELKGTSMSTPLIAGSISALQMVKEYPSREVLFGDIIHLNADFAAIYSDETPRWPKIDVVCISIDDSAEGDNNDGQVDVGEMILINPQLINTWADATDIKLRLSVDERYEDFVEIENPEVDFGYSLSAYGQMEAKTPIKVKFNNNIGDNTRINFALQIDYAEQETPIVQELYVTVHNMVKISGLISENRTLTADHVYLVDDNLSIAKGTTLTIAPGTRVEVMGGKEISSFGKIDSNGTPEAPIIFTGHAGALWNGLKTHYSEDALKGSTGTDLYTNTDSTLFTLQATEQTPIQISYHFRSAPFYYNKEKEFNGIKSFKLRDYLDMVYDMTAHTDLLTDPNYLTPAILRLLSDWKAYCSQFPTTPTADETICSSSDVYLQHEWRIYGNPRDTVSHCRFENMIVGNSGRIHPFFIDCEMISSSIENPLIEGVCNNIIGGRGGLQQFQKDAYYTNIVNVLLCGSYPVPKYSQLSLNNYISNYYNASGYGAAYKDKYYTLMIDATSPVIDSADKPSYLGTSREDLIRPYIWEMGNSLLATYGVIDLSNMPPRPYAEAHGIVWKVVVNGYDAQDEFEQLPPLGVGKHKFEVYFNRPMNKEKAPQISFGVRDPWTQNAVAEDGSWNEEGTIYTAYKTITGKTKSDGLNRIYVYGAEDNEFFEIPYEKNRFNIIIQAAGSMATGFAAEAGLGKVDLTWNNENNDIEDAMGYNLYRYISPDPSEGGKCDTVRVNQEIIDIEATSYTDYDVTPGETYYYFYRTLSTDLQEYDVSNVVAVTPLTSTKGDANGSGDVDVADVITTVNYAAGQQPKPFIFEAADMNEDLSIDILDVIGIIKQIMNPNAEAKVSVAAVASYTIEDGVVYVDSPVDIAGVQVQLSLSEKLKENNEKLITVAEDMKGFEHTSAWLSDNDYLFLGYNMNGKTLTAGKHAILMIGDAQIADIRLSDRNGHNIIAESTTVDKIDRMARDVMTINGIYDLQGRKISGKASDLQKLPKGVYIINGVKVVR